MRRYFVILMSSLLITSLHARQPKALSSYFQGPARLQEIHLIWKLLGQNDGQDSNLNGQIREEINRIFVTYYIENRELDVHPFDIGIYQIFLERSSTPMFSSAEYYALTKKKIPPAREYYDKVFADLEDSLDEMARARRNQDKVRYSTALHQARGQMMVIMTLNMLKGIQPDFRYYQPEWGRLKTQDVDHGNAPQICLLWINTWREGTVQDIQSYRKISERNSEQTEDLESLTRELNDMADIEAKLDELSVFILYLLSTLEPYS